MNWNDAVIAALKRYSVRHGTRLVKRAKLIAEELAQIEADTETVGLTPDQTLSRVLGELRDAGRLHFSERRGEYLLIDSTVPVDDEDLPDEMLDVAIKNGILLLNDIPTDDELVLSRRRKGQSRLRALTLINYQTRCAVCDVRHGSLLRASHIVRWSDDVSLRGNLSNVVCLCVFHDPLFEIGYFSFSDTMAIVRRLEKFDRLTELALGAAIKFRSPRAHPPNPAFLARHRIRTGFDK